MKRYINSKSFNIVRHFILLVLFAFLPFMFSEGLLETETTFRFVATGILMALSFLFLLIAAAGAGDIALPAWKTNHFYKLLLVFLVFLGFSIWHTVNKGEAIYDYLKLCTLASLFFFFIVLFKNTNDFISVLLRYLNISVWIFTLIALSQIGLELRNTNNVTVTYLLSSSLGNKNFYAETMALFLPLIMMGIARLKGAWRFISVVNTVIIIITLIALQTLSTWMAMAVFLLFAAGMVIYMGARKMLPVAIPGGKLLALIGIPLILISLSVPLLYQFNQFGQIRVRVGKMREYAKTNEGYKYEDTYHTNSVAERIFLWQNALRMFRDYPVAGAGFDNWKIYNPKYKLPFSQYIMNNSIRYIRPHNDLLLVLAEGGILGFIFFAGIFVYAFILFFRIMKRPETWRDKLVPVLAVSGLLIYLIIACVSLPGDRFYTQVLLFLFFAIICAEYEATGAELPGGRRLIAAICLLSIVSGIALSSIGVKRYASEIHLIYALQAQIKHNWQKMAYHAGMAKNYFFLTDYNAAPIAWYQGKAAFNAGQPALSKFYFEEALRSNPYDLNVLNDLATAVQDGGDNARAMQIYDYSLSMAPFFTDAFFNKVILMYNTGKKDSAYAFLHTFPRYHGDDDYDHILKVMLTNRAIIAIGDTTVSKAYLKRRIYLLTMDSISVKDHIPFEQILLSDTTLAGVRRKLEAQKNAPPKRK